jgi:hypothetical protein
MSNILSSLSSSVSQMAVFQELSMSILSLYCMMHTNLSQLSDCIPIIPLDDFLIL